MNWRDTDWTLVRVADLWAAVSWDVFLLTALWVADTPLSRACWDWPAHQRVGYAPPRKKPLDFFRGVWYLLTQRWRSR